MTYLRLRRYCIALLLVLLVGIFWPAQLLHSNTSSRHFASGLSHNMLNAGPGPTATLALINGTVLDGTGAPPLANGVVVVEGKRIVAVGPATQVDIPANAQVVDVAGRTIMPGIINAHVHNTYAATIRQQYLASGVTTTCDLASSLADMPQFGETIAANVKYIGG